MKSTFSCNQWCHESIKLPHRRAEAATVSIRCDPLFVGDVRTMTSRSLFCPPSVWLSASFTLAIFSYFANLPSRWDNRKLPAVSWLQMSGADVPLFLQCSCDFFLSFSLSFFFFYQFPALYTFDLFIDMQIYCLTISLRDELIKEQS